MVTCWWLGLLMASSMFTSWPDGLWDLFFPSIIFVVLVPGDATINQSFGAEEGGEKSHVQLLQLTATQGPIFGILAELTVAAQGAREVLLLQYQGSPWICCRCLSQGWLKCKGARCPVQYFHYLSWKNTPEKIPDFPYSQWKYWTVQVNWQTYWAQTVRLTVWVWRRWCQGSPSLKQRQPLLLCA